MGDKWLMKKTYSITLDKNTSAKLTNLLGILESIGEDSSQYYFTVESNIFCDFNDEPKEAFVIVATPKELGEQ